MSTPRHFVVKCPNRKGAVKIENMVIGETAVGISGYCKYLPTFLSVCNSPKWWIDTGANIHVCADIFVSSCC
jgi:hypothetical protein